MNEARILTSEEDKTLRKMKLSSKVEQVVRGVWAKAKAPAKNSFIKSFAFSLIYPVLIALVLVSVFFKEQFGNLDNLAVVVVLLISAFSFVASFLGLNVMLMSKIAGSEFFSQDSLFSHSFMDVWFKKGWFLRTFSIFTYFTLLALLAYIGHVAIVVIACVLWFLVKLFVVFIRNKVQEAMDIIEKS